MCVIIHLLPGKRISSEKLFIAAANNWHSWGLIVKKGKNLEIFRKVPENAWMDEKNKDAGGCHCDVGQMEEMLYSEENINCDRYLHLRHATKGHVNIENCHPFGITAEKRQVYIMHNGTIGGFGTPIVNGNGYSSQGQRMENAPSDTIDFLEKQIKVPLVEFVKGDYTNKYFQEFIWSHNYTRSCQSSRFLFIANDLADWKVGAWHSEHDSETAEILYYSSNSDYFDKIIRGPLHHQAQEEERLRKEKERKENEVKGGGDVVITPFKNGMFQIDKVVLDGLASVMQTFGDNLVPGEIADLGECDIPEWEAVINTLLTKGETLTLACFVSRIMTEFMILYNERERLYEKHTKATELIAKLQSGKMIDHERPANAAS